jgi:ketosteroid isomerase-like protein
MGVSSKPFGEAWIAEYFAMVDRLDPEELVSWYADDASFRFANQPPVRGKAAITAALRQFYGLITAMRHEKTGCWADEHSGAWEAIAHVETRDGRALALPAVSTLRLRDGLIHDFRFVMDASPITEGAPRRARDECGSPCSQRRGTDGMLRVGVNEGHATKRSHLMQTCSDTSSPML